MREVDEKQVISALPQDQILEDLPYGHKQTQLWKNLI